MHRSSVLLINTEQRGECIKGNAFKILFLWEMLLNAFFFLVQLWWHKHLAGGASKVNFISEWKAGLLFRVKIRICEHIPASSGNSIVNFLHISAFLKVEWLKPHQAGIEANVYSLSKLNYAVIHHNRWGFDSREHFFFNVAPSELFRVSGSDTILSEQWNNHILPQA